MLDNFRNWIWERRVREHLWKQFFHMAMFAYLLENGKSPSTAQERSMTVQAQTEADDFIDEKKRKGEL